jgi:ACS family pantothenate transporter-like MFS transporter
MPKGLKFFTYISIGCTYGSIPVLVAWTAEVLAGNLGVRAISLASYDMFSEIVGLALPLVAQPVGKAPGSGGRFSWATGHSVVYSGIVPSIVVLSGRKAKREEKVVG